MFNSIERKLTVGVDSLANLSCCQKKSINNAIVSFWWGGGGEKNTHYVIFYEHCALKLGVLNVENCSINTNDINGLHSCMYHMREPYFILRRTCPRTNRVKERLDTYPTSHSLLAELEFEPKRCL